MRIWIFKSGAAKTEGNAQGMMTSFNFRANHLTGTITQTMKMISLPPSPKIESDVDMSDDEKESTGSGKVKV